MVLYRKACSNETCVEYSGSVGRKLWLLVRNSPPVELLWCVLEQDTLSAV